MLIGRPNIVQASIAIAVALVFVVGGHFAVTGLIHNQQNKQLDDLSRIALRRMETAIDYGALTLNEFASRGKVSCDATELQAVRLHVYQRGSVKDIRVLGRDGGVRCSAYEETLEFDNGWASRDEMLPARDDALRVFRVEQFSGVALGVLKDLDDDISLAAIIGINSSLFDIMPGDLRDDSEVIIELNDGQRIVRSSASAQLDEAGGAVIAASASERYPVRAMVRVSHKAFGLWNNDPYYPILSTTGLLGLIFGALVAKLAGRREGPLADLDRALGSDEITPYFQPIFHLSTGAIIGCEVLARWVKPDGSVIPPVRFIQLAEENGRIAALTWQVLGKALKEIGPSLQHDRPFKLSVNIAPRHFVEPNFVSDLEKVLAGARVGAHRLVLELTEREELESLPRCAAVVADLNALGIRVALDDVGIGHSGLSYIHSLGAKILKIDKFFVDSICRDPSAISIVAMLVRLSRELGMNIVAEGIETSDQRSALLRCGVTEGQGYLVSPPVPGLAFLDLLGREPVGMSPADMAAKIVALAS